MKTVRTIYCPSSIVHHPSSIVHFAAVVLFLCACPALGWLQFKDGLTHNIDYTINDDVWVDYQVSQLVTTVNLLSGGNISSPYKLQGFEHSRINILGGSIDQLYSYDSSQVALSGGSIGGLESRNSSRVDMSGGSIGSWLQSCGSSQVNMSGGSISYLYSCDSSQVDISGGSISGDLILYQQSMIQIFGSDFAVDGVPFGFGELTSILCGSPWDDPHRRLTGTLLSGEPIDNVFRIGNDARITLIPEPATMALLGIGLLFLRKRQEGR